MPVFSSAAIAEEAQKLAQDRLVKLYELDATMLGGQYYYFISSVDASLPLVSLTRSGYVATATTGTNHLLQTGQQVRINNALQTDYNGDYTVTVISPTVFTYTILLNTVVTPATTLTGLQILATRLNNTMIFDENEYHPVSFDADGFEWNGQGTLPTPKIRISNVNKVLQSAVIGLKDLVGATFIRKRTYRKFLDDGISPDTDAMFPVEVYRVNRKSNHTKLFIEFELAASFDQQNAKIPGRICLKTTCTQRYRQYNPVTHTFDYSKATCPYAGTSYFMTNNVSTSDPSMDACGKQLSSCKLRFGSDPLPTRAVPGIGGR